MEFNDLIDYMDCIEGMKLIPDGSVDCIITDPPYKKCLAFMQNITIYNYMYILFDYMI